MAQMIGAATVATAAAAGLPLLVIYDDSLQNRWRVAEGGASTELEAPRDAGRLRGGQAVPCGRSIRTIFNRTSHLFALKSDEPVVLAHSLPLLLSFAFDTAGWSTPPPRCGLEPAQRGSCAADFCVSVRQNTTGHQNTLYLPLCVSGDRLLSDTRSARLDAAAKTDGWVQMEVPLQSFGVDKSGSLDQVAFVRGDGAGNSAPLHLNLDEIWLASRRMPRAGDNPPSYGRGDINVVRRNWLEGVTRLGAANNPAAKENPHFCEYMSSELGREQSARPLCKVGDGDHLRGRWVQTCDPRLIRRPDHFAYGRALPSVKGWYDYRLCYRQSATERLRALQTITWSWRPFSCAMRPVRGEEFDRWLGARTILFLGDSLNAQAYYSLIWLLGDFVIEQKDLFGRVPGEDVVGEVSLDKCHSNVGNEGGWLSTAHLRGGGKLIKVLRHAELFTEITNSSSFFQPYVHESDFVVLNWGHHFHRMDPTFRTYQDYVTTSLNELTKQMKPSAHLVFRTTNIGHYACENATRPMRSRTAAWAELTGKKTNIYEWKPPQMYKANAGLGVDIFNDKYNWRGPPLHETAWEETAKAMPAMAARFATLNVSFLDMRSDGHVATSMRYSSEVGEFGAKWKTAFPLDCLHYCYPGPADFWALALTNLLMNNERYQAK